MALVDVTPRLSSNDKADEDLRHTMFHGKVNLTKLPGGVLLANDAHMVIRQFCSAVCFATNLWLNVRMVCVAVAQSALTRCIADVVARGSKPQMFRVYTVPNIAGMADKKSIGDNASVKFPRNAVGLMVFLIGSNDNPVPPAFDCAGPQPACFSLGDVLPEAVSEGNADVNAAGLGGKLFAHLKFLSGVVPAAAQTACGLLFSMAQEVA